MTLSVKSVSNRTLVDGQPYAEALVARDAGPNVNWILQLSPPGATISPQGVVQWVASYTGEPAHFSVTASDDEGGAGGRSWKVTVKAAEPRVTVANQRLDDLSELRYTPTLVEGTGPIVWSLSKSPESMTIDPQSGEIRWEAEFSSKPVKVKVKAKGPGGSQTESFTVEVVPASPIIDAIAKVTVRDGATWQGLASVSYGSGDMRWSIASGPDGLRIDAKTGEMTYKAVYAEVAYLARVKVVGPGGEHTKAFQIEVQPLLPLIVPPEPGMVDEGATYEITPALSQGSGTIAWTLESGPDGMAVDGATGAVTWDATASELPVKAKIKAEGPGGAVSTEWSIKVISPPALAAIADAQVTEGETFTQVVTLDKGSGPLDFTVSGHPRGTHITLPKRKIAWKASTAGSPANFKVKAEGPTGAKAERTFKVEVVPRDEELVQQCPQDPQEQEDPLPQCCNFQLKMHCKHVVGTSPNDENQDIRAGSHGWAGFHGTPFAFVNPRNYTMKFPPTGTPTANEKAKDDRTEDDLAKFVVGKDTRYPVYQVLAGRVQLADLVTTSIEHESGCPGDRVYSVCVLRKGQSSSAKTLTWTEVKPKSSEAEEYGLVAGAEAEFSNVPLKGEWRTLVKYNPFRWFGLPRNQWDVGVIDEAGTIVKRDGVPMRVTVEACSDIRWEINVGFGRSSQAAQGARVNRLPGESGGFDAEFRHDPDDPSAPEPLETDSGWTLVGTAKVAYDQYVHSFEYQLAQNLETALGFLTAIDAASSFLSRAMSFAPGFDGSLRKPALSLYFAAEPYEQEDVALVGYQWKLGLGAKPLMGVEIELNLLHLILAVCPYTAPFVPVLKALKAGVGVKGVARVKVDVGVYLIAGGEIGVELEWAYQKPDGHAAYGLIDARIDFKIEGRVEAEIEVLVVSGGAGVRIGAKTAVGLCLKAASGDGPTLQGQTRWEGIVLYMLVYYKAGLKIGSFSKSKSRTKTKVLVVAKPRYWPKAPPPQG